MEEKNLELKIGVLIFISIVILVVFVLLLGHITTKKGFYIYVYFVNPGGLTPGSPVKISGSRVGRVVELSYLGSSGPINPKLSSLENRIVRARVKVKIWLEERVKDSIHKEDAQFYITTQGILGEPFLEIDPGSKGELIKPGDSVFGIDPPRLDRVVANAASSLSTLNRILENNEENIDTILKSLAIVTKNLAEITIENKDRVSQLITELISTVEVTKDSLEKFRNFYIDGAQPKRILNNIDRITERLSSPDSLIAKSEAALDKLNSLLEILTPKDGQKLKSIISRFDSIGKRLEAVLKDIEDIMDKVKRGEGTVGALLNDEEVYDDLKELIRDLKHNPWKFFWRE